MLRVLLALLLSVAALAGQNAPPMPRESGPKTSQGRGDITARLYRMRLERLQQSLGISEEKAKAIADRWSQFDQDSHDSRRRVKQLHQQVNGILFSPLSEDEKNARIRPLVEQYSAIRQQQDDLKRKFEDDIRGTLTPAQQGRFLLVAEEMQRALFEAIKAQRSGTAGQ